MKNFPEWGVTLAIVIIGGIVTYASFQTHTRDMEVVFKRDIGRIEQEVKELESRLRPAELSIQQLTTTLDHIERDVKDIKQMMLRLVPAQS